MSGADSSFDPMARRLAGACGRVVCAAGPLVLIGWAVDSTALTRVSHDLPAMDPLTAIALIALGAALVLSAPPGGPWSRRRAAIAFASIATLIGATELAERVVGDLGIDGAWSATCCC